MVWSFVAVLAEGTTAAVPPELSAALDAAGIKHTTITIRGENDLHTLSPWFRPDALYLLVGAHP